MEESRQELIQQLIKIIDGDAYRKGTKKGMCHPEVTNHMMKAAGGRAAFIKQAQIIEKDPVLGRSIKFIPGNLGMDIVQVHCAVEIMPELCSRIGIEDPRARQLRYIQTMEQWKEKAGRTWLTAYYEDELDRLNRGKCSEQLRKQMDDEQGALYLCLDEMIHLEEPLEKPIFSARVFQGATEHDRRITPSKRFRKQYQKRVCGIIKDYSPEYIEDMSEDEMLATHGILSYSQTLEWKGRVICTLDDGHVIDTGSQVYGTVLNAKTLEHIESVKLPGIQRILIIENKANYEKMEFNENELYVFCHGFFSPKEVRVLKKIEESAGEAIKYEHWGDLDYGGIRIFQYNKSEVFAELHPYKMDRDTYCQAIENGTGIPLEEGKRRKLEMLDAGMLESLKNSILKQGMEIEQELLIQ